LAELHFEQRFERLTKFAARTLKVLLDFSVRKAAAELHPAGFV